MFTANTKYGKMSCWKNDQAFVTALKKNKVYEEDLVINELQDIIKSSTVILDIGAHIGSHTLIYSKLNPNCIIHSFEPQTKIFELLKLNVTQNKCNNVILHNNCVGHKIRTANMSKKCVDGHNINKDINYGSDTTFNLGGLQLGKDGEKVEMLTIDSLQLTGCDFIKIDVEGAEPLVLKGGEATIKKFKPKILFEQNNKKLSPEMINYLDASDINMDSIEILKSYGYTTFKKVIYENNPNYLAF